MSDHTFEVDAVLFDMDGTLVDSRALVERMWLIWAAQHNLDPKAILAVAHGRRTLETMQLVAPELATLDEATRLDALEEQQDGGKREQCPAELNRSAALTSWKGGSR